MWRLSLLRSLQIRSYPRLQAVRQSRLQLEEMERRDIPSASGVYALLPAGATIPAGILSNPSVDGVVLRAHWSSLEPANSAYDWTINPTTNYLDTQIRAASAAGKKVALSVAAGAYTYPFQGDLAAAEAVLGAAALVCYS